MTGYVKNVQNGPAKSFYKNGKIWSEQWFLDGKLEGKAISYTPKGDTALIEEWRNSQLKSRIIYYNSTNDEPQHYYFVSKKGFPLLLNGVQTKLDKTTPDSLIEEGPGYTYMWLKGEKKLIAGEEAPKFIMITTGEKPGVYVVKGDKQTFSRPFTEGEKKLFMKSSCKKIIFITTKARRTSRPIISCDFQLFCVLSFRVFSLFAKMYRETCAGNVKTKYFTTNCTNLHE